MKHNFILLVALFGFLSNVIGQTTYYIDSVDGSDSNNGLSEGAAWQSIGKVNQSTFLPGNRILFKSGREFSGKLIPPSSGDSSNPITFGKYGGVTRPTINGKNYLMCIDASGKEYLTFENLILKNDASEDTQDPETGALTKRYGFYASVYASVGFSGIKRNITLNNIKAYKIYPTNASGTENTDSYKGYGFLFTSSGSGENYYDGITIKNCEITDIGYVGISINKWIPDTNPPTAQYQQNIDINNNNLHRIGGSGMVFFNVQNFLIENNIVTYTGDYSLNSKQHGRGSGFWSVRCKDGVLQNNEFSHVRGAADSCGAHIDIENDNVIVQYNVSYDNAGGFAEFMGANTNCIYRYNVSINDGFRVKWSNGATLQSNPEMYTASGQKNTQNGKIIWFSDFTGFDGQTKVGAKNNQVYNNTIYIGQDTNGDDITSLIRFENDTDSNEVKNNIFYVESESTLNFTKSSTAGDNNVFSNNLYSNVGPSNSFFVGTSDLTNSDPLFVNKGGANATDYKILTGSPAIDSGVDMPNNGGFDYWSNSLPGSTNFDIGAQEFNTNTWNGASSSSWATPANWSRNDIPNSTDEVIISNVTNDPVIEATTGADVNNLTIDSEASLTISSGGSLIVNGSSSGNITYNRNLATTNWYLVSSPVVGETYDDAYVTANGITSGTQNTNSRGIAPYVTTDDSWDYMLAGETATFSAGNGYTVKRSSVGTVSFTGTLNVDNTGVDVVLSSDGNRFNLLGNPYTSHISSATFLANEDAVSDTQTLWVWDQGSGSGAYEVKTLADPIVIAPAQGFFVKANAAGGTFNFTESNQASSGGTFQRTVTRPEIYLTISDQTDAREAKIYYIENMTTGFDVGYEGELFGGTTDSFSIYTQLLTDNINKKYQVQSLPNSDYENMVIPVGVNAAAGKEITFSADALNLPTDIKVFLEDRLTNTFTRLDETNSEYRVTLTESLNGVGRFYLHTAQSVLSTEDVILNSVRIFKTDASTLKITGLPQGIANLKLYNILGKQMMSASFESNGMKKISLPRLATGVYIVQLETIMGTVNKKIILN